MRKLILPKTIKDLLNPSRLADLKESMQILTALQQLKLVINNEGESSTSSLQLSGGVGLLVGRINAAFPLSIRWLIVAGGGGGGARLAGGGGAGGVRSSDIEGPILISPTITYPVIVGIGGAAVISTPTVGKIGLSGQNSVVFNKTSLGGGGGGAYQLAGGVSGGSGGGGTFQSLAGGIGIVGQGNNGGSGTNLDVAGAGGGGAGQPGSNPVGIIGAKGGDGLANSISGVAVYYGGGGGGAGQAVAGAGGLGGGGAGATGDNTPATSGTANTGGGGGASRGVTDTVATVSGAGGSGIIIIRYSGPARFSGGVITTVDDDTIHRFVSSGTLTPL